MPVDGTTDAPPAPGARALPYQPALDGLRGVAVAGVLLFHGGFGWAEGGYLGVSTFFTLSGFLITSLLLAEADTSGHVALRSFWARRVRRLLPASLAALLLACAYGAFVADAAQVARLRGDVLAALAYVANWRFIADDQAYADLFSGPSPVLHFWSLAIEEQFYLLYPLLVVALLGRRRIGRHARRPGGEALPRRLGTALVLLTAASVALASSGVLSDDVVYLATPTRAAEMLVGCLLAVALHHEPTRSRLAEPGTARVAGAAGVLALGAGAVLWSTTEQSAEWLYRGGFTAYSLLSAVVIVACLAPTPVRRALAWEPLRRVGLISYGLYLVHWPVFLWVDGTTDLGDGPRFAIGVAVSVALAVLSAAFIEQPVRRRGRYGRLRAAPLAPVGIAVVALAAVLVTADPPPPAIDVAAAEESAARARASNRAPTTTPATDGPATGAASAAASASGGSVPAPPVPRIALYGDSTALTLSTGFNRWIAESPDADFGSGVVGLGCAVGRGGRWGAGDETGAVDDTCSWSDYWGPQAAKDGHDVAVVLSGPWDVSRRLLPGTDEWVHIGQPDYDAWLYEEMLGATDALAAAGSEVVWLTSPPIADERAPRPRRDETADPARMERYNAMVARVVAARPGTAHLVDLAGWLEASGRDDDYRPDGTHLSEEGAYAATVELLGPEIVALFRADRASSG